MALTRWLRPMENVAREGRGRPRGQIVIAPRPRLDAVTRALTERTPELGIPARPSTPTRAVFPARSGFDSPTRAVGALRELSAREVSARAELCPAAAVAGTAAAAGTAGTAKVEAMTPTTAAAMARPVRSTMHLQTQFYT